MTPAQNSAVPPSQLKRWKQIYVLVTFTSSFCSLAKLSLIIWPGKAHGYIYKYIYMHINSWKFQWHRCSGNLWILYTMEGVRYVTNECMKTSEYIYGHTICNTLLQTILFIPLLLPIYSKFSYLLLKVLSCYHFCSFLFKIPTVYFLMKNILLVWIWLKINIS